MNTDEWYTPPEIIRSFGDFDLDPATSLTTLSLNHSTERFYTKKEDGLLQSWTGSIWLNPPYSHPLIEKFLAKMAEHNNGIALVFAKIEAKWFHDTVLYHAGAAKFLYDRIRFLRPYGTPETQPRNSSMLLAYGRENIEILYNNPLKGKFVLL